MRRMGEKRRIREDAASKRKRKKRMRKKSGIGRLVEKERESARDR